MILIRRKLFHSLGLLIGVCALSSQQKVSADELQNIPQSPLYPLIQALRQPISLFVSPLQSDWKRNLLLARRLICIFAALI